ncbi:MAG: glycosyltransferase [Actinobacteria bacterium]|nr:MAG: glycosyltransferase [Actinomycetota bacterium]
MKIAVVYDCLYPHTIGGAERWYRSLAEGLAAHGHEVTYLTMRQWPRGADPGFPGVEVVPVAPRMGLYVRGRRRILPPVVFGAGVFWHLLRHGRRYDVLHTCSFPYFSLLAAAWLRPFRKYRVVADWFEVWSREYWREYLGRLGFVGAWIQRRCARTRHMAFCFSRLHAERLRKLGFRGEVTILEGLLTGRPSAPGRPAEPLVVFAGRHIPEKRVPAIVPAIARARKQLPGLRCEIFGDGPEREETLRLIREYGLNGAVEAPGFVSAERVHETIARALCLLLPSSREGYGLVVAEAASMGTPSVVVEGPDNAAAELVETGINGIVALSAAPDDLAEAIRLAHEGGDALRASTKAWFERNADRLSIETSVDRVVSAYEHALA